jgi:leucyl aminopeptidase
LPLAIAKHVRAPAEVAVIGGDDGRRRRSSSEPPRDPERLGERLGVCGRDEELTAVAARAEVVARWTNVAHELVDAAANVISPTRLSDRVVNFDHLANEIIDPDSAGVGELVARLSGASTT